MPEPAGRARTLRRCVARPPLRRYPALFEVPSQRLRLGSIRREQRPFREIAEVIGRRLNLPVVFKSPEEAADHFGWFTRFAAIDCPSSSAKTQELLGWQPKQPGLIADLDRPRYFAS